MRIINNYYLIKFNLHMKKYSSANLSLIIATLSIVLFIPSARAQEFIHHELELLQDPCGTWKADSMYYTGWHDVDTLKNKPIRDTIRNWVYDEERRMYEKYRSWADCPCGCGFDRHWQQYRICQKTGIRQVRYKVQSYEYIPKPKNKYEKTIDSLSNYKK